MAVAVSHLLHCHGCCPFMVFAFHRRCPFTAAALSRSLPSTLVPSHGPLSPLGSEDSRSADAVELARSHAGSRLAATRGREATETRTRSPELDIVTVAPDGAARLATRITAPGLSPLDAARAPARAASTHRIWSQARPNAPIDSARTRTIAGSTTANSAVAMPRSPDLASRLTRLGMRGWVRPGHARLGAAAAVTPTPRPCIRTRSTARP